MRNKLLVSVVATLCVAFGLRAEYIPTPENMESRSRFASDRFGIFIHWGIYSMFAQGEWYLNNGKFTAEEYAKAASGFYPANFNAEEWVSAIKDSGARYITFTTRHHDGFSMFDTEQSDYNIVDASPFKRDILKELADACHNQDVNLHLYYSHIDWTRDDYPAGRTGRYTGKDSLKADWPHYYDFMNAQLTELLSNYGPIRAVWFDGWWDHDEDTVPFNWELDRQYDLVHRLQPACLVGNNHHQVPFAGEDIQIFERDVPGENEAGLSGQDISALPLETCQTMNGMWGYKIIDQNYKPTSEIIKLLVRTAGKGANLLLNIGPQPNGELPEAALVRLKEIGEWMRVYGETIYGTGGAPFEEQEWGTATTKDGKTYVHVISAATTDIEVPMDGKKIKKAKAFATGKEVKMSKKEGKIILHLDEVPSETDFIVELL